MCVFYSVKCDDSSRVSSFRVSRIVTVEISKLEFCYARVYKFSVEAGVGRVTLGDQWWMRVHGPFLELE